MNLPSISFLTFAASLLPAQAPSSTFDTGIDGWQIAETCAGDSGCQPAAPYGPIIVSYAPFHSLTEGAPPGSIWINDQNGRLFFFSAPASYLGDQSAFLGGSLRYQLRFTPSGLAPGSAHPDVVLQGAGVTLVLDAFADPATQTGNWQSHSVPLAASAGWQFDDLGGAAATQQDLANVLGNLTAVLIRGDFWAGVETTFLDNVRLTDTGSVTSVGAGCGTGQPLALAATTMPVQDPVSATTFCVETQNIPAAATIHLGLLSVASANGLPLGALGFAPGCSLWAGTDLIAASVFAPPPAAGLFVWCPVTLPPSGVANLDGFEFYVQAVTTGLPLFTAGRASNGLKCVIGS